MFHVEPPKLVVLSRLPPSVTQKYTRASELVYTGVVRSRGGVSCTGVRPKLVRCPPSKGVARPWSVLVPLAA